MVVTSTLANGSPGTAYPLGSSTLAYTTPAVGVSYPTAGALALDPITSYFYTLGTRSRGRTGGSPTRILSRRRGSSS